MDCFETIAMTKELEANGFMLTLIPDFRSNHESIFESFKRASIRSLRYASLLSDNLRYENCCVLTGLISDLSILRVRIQDRGRETILSLMASGKRLPRTPGVRVGDDFYDYYFRGIVTQSPLRLPVGPGVTLIGDGSPIRIPGCRSRSGELYQWNPQLNPSNCEFAPLPAFLLMGAF